MTKVAIIEVDLGTNIDTIISEDVQELIGAAKKELDDAIDLAKQRDTLREKKSTEKQQASDALTGVMITAFGRLADAGTEGVLCSDIIAIVNEHVPNSSAFSLRMRKILKDQGSPYILERKKRKGNNHYIFSKYNLDQEHI